MTKRLIAILAVTCLLLALLAACGDGTISKEKAQKIVLKDLGVSANEVTMHVHVGEHEGTPCYSIYVTIEGETLEYLIDCNSGEILAINESSHSH